MGLGSWDSEEQLNSITEYVSEWIDTGFPLVLGGEHGILPPIMEAMKKHSRLNGDLSKLTLIQIDAHADLRDELNGERFSHGTAIRRSLDAGVGRVIQIGTRALSESEAIFLMRTIGLRLGMQGNSGFFWTVGGLGINARKYL